MREAVYSGFEHQHSLVIRLWPRGRRVSAGNGIGAAFAAGMALSGILTVSSTAPALLEGANLRAFDTGGDVGVSTRARSAAPSLAPAGMIVEYDSSGTDLAHNGPGPCADGVPVAVRTPLADAQLFARVAASAGNQLAQRASPHKVATVEPSTPSAALVRKKAALRVTGCSRCMGQMDHTPSKRANLFASLLSGDLFHKARLVRPGNRPIGIAQRRESPHLTVGPLRPT